MKNTVFFNNSLTIESDEEYNTINNIVIIYFDSIEIEDC